MLEILTCPSCGNTQPNNPEKHRTLPKLCTQCRTQLTNPNAHRVNWPWIVEKALAKLDGLKARAFRRPSLKAFAKVREANLEYSQKYNEMLKEAKVIE